MFKENKEYIAQRLNKGKKNLKKNLRKLNYKKQESQEVKKTYENVLDGASIVETFAHKEIKDPTAMQDITQILIETQLQVKEDVKKFEEDPEVVLPEKSLPSYDQISLNHYKNQ